MNDKDLSKPVGYASKYDIDLMQRRQIMHGQMTIRHHGEEAVYSDEYVQSLLGRIAELEEHVAICAGCRGAGRPHMQRK